MESPKGSKSNAPKFVAICSGLSDAKPLYALDDGGKAWVYIYKNDIEAHWQQLKDVLRISPDLPESPGALSENHPLKP